MMHYITVLLTCQKRFSELDLHIDAHIILSRIVQFIKVLRDVRSPDEFLRRHAFLGMYRV
jgi:hypothetical protein